MCRAITLRFVDQRVLNAAMSPFTCSYMLPGHQFRCDCAVFRTNSFSKHFLLACTLLLLHYFFQLHWGITHHISNTPLRYSNKRPAAKPLLPNCRKKLEGKCKKVRKGTGIFCSRLKLVSFHASSLCMGLYLYCKLCTNNVTLTSLQTAVSTARSDGNEHNLVGKNETYMSNCITRDSFPR